MKFRAFLYRPRSVRHLGMALIGIWSVMAALGLGWTFMAWRNRSLESESKLAGKDLAARISEAETSIAKARVSPDTKVPKGLASISAFQTAATNIASKWGCALTEFQASSQVADYLTRFAKDTKTTDWKQIDISATMRGSAPFLVAALKEIASCGVPFEFNSIDFRRAEVSDTGTATVACVLSLRLVTRDPRSGA